MSKIEMYSLQADGSKEIDRASAALEQMENSISCFFQGEWASSVTLALAVEGMLPPCPEDIDIWNKSKRFLIAEGHDESAATVRLNKQRNWLKHPKADNTMSFTIDETAFAILRAYTRLTFNTGRISDTTKKFEAWFDINFPTFENESRKMSTASGVLSQ